MVGKSSHRDHREYREFKPQAGIPTTDKHRYTQIEN
jgi:hypothetical protein